MKPTGRVGRATLEAAYAAWPGLEGDKTALRALLLRLRIEDVAVGVPRTVIAAAPHNDRIRQRLMLAVGEPGLNSQRRADRLRVVLAGVATYQALCQVLHGRVPDGRPPLVDVAAWEVAVVKLEEEFGPKASVPQQREESEAE